MGFIKMQLSADQFLPLEFVFNPNWWNHEAGIGFDRNFYLDPVTREANDVIMRRVLFEKFGSYGFGEPNPEPRPVIGSEFVAGGFVIPALLGAEIRFSSAEAPQPLPQKWLPEQIDAFSLSDIRNRWPLNELIAGWNDQKKRYGYLQGDLNTDGLLNAAYHFYGPDLFSDLIENPDRPVRFMREIGKLIIDTALIIQQQSTSVSIGVNRMAAHLSPSPFIHSNCSVQMISPRTYQKYLLPLEQEMALRIQPYGVHHCGVKTETYAKYYAQIPLSYCEIGWESNPALCRQELPGVFLNLRLSPIRMLNCSAAEIKADVEFLLDSAKDLSQVGICCINIDHGTPEENLITVCETVVKYRKDHNNYHG